MRDLVGQYLAQTISRRGFLDNMKAAGITVAAAEGVLSSLNASAQTSHPQALLLQAPQVHPLCGPFKAQEELVLLSS